MVALLHFGIFDHFVGWSFKIISPADSSHKVDKDGGGVDFPRPFGSAIVPGKGVVIIVVAFACGVQIRPKVFCRLDLLVVRSYTPEMIDGIDGKSTVENAKVAKDPADEERREKIFVPVINGDESWDGVT